MNKAQHICFYSNKCIWSKAFIEGISKTPYVKQFNYICVDPSPNRQPLPSWLKQTPTLVIKGENEPRMDEQVMNWLFEKKLQGGGDDSKGVANPEPVEYLPAEMGGFADKYSFIDTDTSAQGNGGLAHQNHSFTYLNGPDSISSREAKGVQMNESSGKISKKQQMFDSQYELMMKSREESAPRGPQRL
jgi:hypothetical protein